MLRSFIVALQCLLVLSEDGHDHGEGVFEWAGIFETAEDAYMWTAQKVKANDGHVEYVDPSMKMVALPAAAATEQALHALESEAIHAFEKNCKPVEAGGTIKPMEDTCYLLNFKQAWWQSLYTIDATGTNAIAFFTEHMPTEFENTAHYLKDDHGDDIEPVAELPEAGDEAIEAPWGNALGAAAIVNVVTLVGVVALVPLVSRLAVAYALEFEALACAFAAGALLACAFFLLLFESTHLIAVGHEEEVAVVWRWGTMILAGFVLPGLIHMVVDTVSAHTKQAQPDANAVVASEEKQSLEAGDAPFPARARVIGGVLIGDFFHNLCDGFFVGAAFKRCGGSFGWTVAGSTIAHEVAQEFSDYFILTGSVGKLRPGAALGLNFLSGISVMLGVIIVLSEDISDESIGLLLAFGGGVYLHIAATECMPKIYSHALSFKIRLACLSVFILGAIAIGLVLLDHEHCIPDGAAGDHHGHNH